MAYSANNVYFFGSKMSRGQILASCLTVAPDTIADANLFLTNGIAKTGTSTLNLPDTGYEQDKWGVLQYYSENDTDVTGVQIYYRIAYAGSSHRGEIYRRLIISGTPTAWEKYAVEKTGGTTLDSPLVIDKQYVLGAVSSLSLTLPDTGTYHSALWVIFDASEAFTPTISGSYTGDTVAETVANKTYEYKFHWNGSEWVLSIVNY